MAKTIIGFCVILFISSTVYATDITVGGSSGWTTGFDYVTWAASRTFTTNDTLVFNYGPSHSLDEVTQSGYDNCNGANPINSTALSPTRIPLTTAGTRYFICPRSDHCSRGMKLAVTVSGGGATTTPSPPPSSPATPGTLNSSQPPPSPPSTSTPTPPPPPPKSAAFRVSRKSSLLAGTFIGLGVVFGLMG